MHLALAYQLEQHIECFLGVMTSFGHNMANMYVQLTIL